MSAESDRIGELVYKAQGIVGVIRAASAGNPANVPDDAIEGACWAVEHMIGEIGELSSKMAKAALK